MTTPIENALPTDFTLGKPSKRRNWTNPDCCPLNEVTHVTHISSAVSIAREGCLRPRLVYDDSRLNKSRVLVNWLSPNYWANGSRYGSIELTFDWPLASARHPYWVEAIDYEVTACRFLLTNDKSVEKSLGLTRYDPARWEGPWGLDSKGKHWWNGEHCLEFMVHDEIGAEQVKRVSFVKHHPDWCSIHRTSPTDCTERDLRPVRAGARFVAALVGEGLHALDHTLTSSSDPTSDLQDAFQQLLGDSVQLATFGGTLHSDDDRSAAIARSTLSAFSRGSQEDWRSLLSLFATSDDATIAVRRAVAAHFGVRPSSLDEEE
ncbi:MAG: hypothetical protein KF696_05070 [Planctomycetes bacterium]|nr:hypothetical protein [Planctomycetota bacterium]MCW8136257.1 hypothetical protein [Planctomycetota bacterium]